MALIKCPQCGTEVLDRMTKCVKCGCSLKERGHTESPASPAEDFNVNVSDYSDSSHSVNISDGDILVEIPDRKSALGKIFTSKSNALDKFVLKEGVLTVKCKNGKSVQSPIGDVNSTYAKYYIAGLPAMLDKRHKYITVKTPEGNSVTFTGYRIPNGQWKQIFNVLKPKQKFLSKLDKILCAAGILFFAAVFVSEVRNGLNDTDTYMVRADRYEKKGDYERAAAAYGQAIRLDSNNANAYNNRGNIYFADGDYDLAIADFDRAIRLDPSDAVKYFNRGFVYNSAGDHDEAIADFNRSIELNPNDPDVYDSRGFAYTKKGDYALAIADFDKAIQLNPNHADAYDNRADVYASMGDYTRAAADYEAALRINPEHAFAGESLRELRLNIEKSKKIP